MTIQNKSTSQVDSIEGFKEQQRARYLMSPAMLEEEITRERADALGELFGIALHCKNHPDIGTQPHRGYRFPNDLTALRMFVQAALALKNSGNPMARLGNGGLRKPFSEGGPLQRSQEIKIRKKTHRAFENEYLSRCLDDFVDVGLRLDTLEDERLELLISYYVLGRSAVKLSSFYHIEPSQLGGRISQARKALQKALCGLIPSREFNGKTGEGIASRPLDEMDRRRDKVSRLLSKRIQ